MRIRDAIQTRFTNATMRRDLAAINVERAKQEVIDADREFDAAYAAWIKVYHNDNISVAATKREGVDKAPRVGA